VAGGSIGYGSNSTDETAGVSGSLLRKTSKTSPGLRAIRRRGT
jgi:hypothetical protein